MSTPSPEPEPTFTPQGSPLTLEEMAEYVDDGGVVVKRSDVQKAIASSDKSLKPYLQSPQYKSTKK